MDEESKKSFDISDDLTQEEYDEIDKLLVLIDKTLNKMLDISKPLHCNESTNNDKKTKTLLDSKNTNLNATKSHVASFKDKAAKKKENSNCL